MVRMNCGPSSRCEKWSLAPFPEEEVIQLKHEVITLLRTRGWQLERHREDGTDFSMDLSLKGARDPQTGRVGPGTRMPRLRV